MKRKSVKSVLLLLFFFVLVFEACKKDESSPTASTPASEPTFTYTLDGTNYVGEASATIRKTAPHTLTVWTKSVPASGAWVKLEIFFYDTSSVGLNKPIDMHHTNVLYGHVSVGDTNYAHVMCSAMTGAGGTLTVTKWTGKEIAGTFVMSGITHYDPVRTCNVTNGTFRASSIQEVP